MNRLHCIKGDGVEVLSGLCAGIGYWLTIPTWIVRLVFFALLFATAGNMILVYIVLAIVIPDINTPEDYRDLVG